MTRTTTARRIAIPIRRVHADGTTCAHKIGPSGRPRDGQGCPGPAGYQAACRCGCGWTAAGGIRAIVEEKTRTYRLNHPTPAQEAAASEGAPEDGPGRIDWPARQQAAWFRFEVVDGLPINPFWDPQTHRYDAGRGELWTWGEQQCADAVVTAHHDGHHWLAMVERRDGHGWAIPGGKVDPGEDALAAAIRELAEETGLTIPGAAWKARQPRYVPDPRASRHAWMVTTPVTAHLGRVGALPAITGADDARRAAWIRADDYDAMAGHLADAYGGRVFAAHMPMLRELLG